MGSLAGAISRNMGRRGVRSRPNQSESRRLRRRVFSPPRPPPPLRPPVFFFVSSQRLCVSAVNSTVRELPRSIKANAGRRWRNVILSMPVPRIVSLIASATEIVDALGQLDHLAGRPGGDAGSYGGVPGLRGEAWRVMEERGAL